MLSIFINWLIVAFAVWATAMVLPGVEVKSFKSALLVAAVFGVLNFLLGWLLFSVFTIGTLGLAYVFAFLTWWIINAILLKLTDALTDSIKIDGFLMTLLAAASISLFSALGRYVVELMR